MSQVTLPAAVNETAKQHTACCMSDCSCDSGGDGRVGLQSDSFGLCSENGDFAQSDSFGSGSENDDCTLRQLWVVQ